MPPITAMPAPIPSAISPMPARARRAARCASPTWPGSDCRRRMRWPAGALTSALLRGSYHLYQGVGAFLGNAVMGLVFVWAYRRWGRVTPLIVAHFLLDAFSFVGYALLAPWLTATFPGVFS